VTELPAEQRRRGIGDDPSIERRTAHSFQIQVVKTADVSPALENDPTSQLIDIMM
jgi:hypothetical protein